MTDVSWIFLSHSFCTRSLTKSNAAKAFVRGLIHNLLCFLLVQKFQDQWVPTRLNCLFILFDKFGRWWRRAFRYCLKKSESRRENSFISCYVIHQNISLPSCKLTGQSKVIFLQPLVSLIDWLNSLLMIFIFL